MASQLISGDLISDRYALALYDLAFENKVIDLVLENFESIQDIINNNKELQLLMKSPLIISNDKLEILLKIMFGQNLNELSITFLKVISQNKRFASLLSIISQFVNINAKKKRGCVS